MKVLWFTNTPCGANEKLGYNIQNGGWLASLEKELVKQRDIQLSVCFYAKQDLPPFSYKGTSYYPVYRKNSDTKFGRFIYRFLHKTYNNRAELTKLLSIVSEVNPDIIHVHGTEDNFGLIQGNINIPVIISIQGILSAIFHKYFSGIPYAVFNKFEGIAPKIFLASVRSQKRGMINKVKCEKSILSKARFIIGRTEWDRSITNFFSQQRIYFKVNEILRDSFYKKVWEQKEFNKPIRLISVISKSFYKGLETIIDSVLLLMNNHFRDFNWTIIGIKESDHIVKVLKKWKKIDFNTLSVRFLGLKKEDELLTELLSSDIYCQVSHIENSPNSLCEAMLVGMPVIATYAGGTSSLITHKKEGILVQEGEPYSYAGAIIELANNFELARQYAKAARERAIKRHDKYTIVNDLLSIYRYVLKQTEEDKNF